MIRRPPRSTLFPTRRSSDLIAAGAAAVRCCGWGDARRSARPSRLATRGIAERRERHVRAARPSRSEEHTSELQSQSNLVCRLLLEKKKKKEKKKEERK